MYATFASFCTIYNLQWCLACSRICLSFNLYTYCILDTRKCIAWELTSTSTPKPSNGFSGIREHDGDSLIRDDFVFFFLDFGGFQGSETPIKHAQNLKLIAELNSTHGDGPTSVNNLS